MKLKLIEIIKNLLIYWIINFVLYGIALALIIFIGTPLFMMVINNAFSTKFFPSVDDIYKVINVWFFAAFFSGLILWVKGEFFTKK